MQPEPDTASQAVDDDHRSRNRTVNGVPDTPAAMTRIDFLSPGVLADPHAVLKRMRASMPVLWNEKHRA